MKKKLLVVVFALIVVFSLSMSIVAKSEGPVDDGPGPWPPPDRRIALNYADYIA